MILLRILGGVVSLSVLALAVSFFLVMFFCYAEVRGLLP